MLTYRVVCGGQAHRIALAKKGQLVALDHSPKLRRERNFMELGGKEPACHEMVTNYLAYDHPIGNVPHGWQDVVEAAMRKRRERRANRVSPYLYGRISPFDKLRAYTQLAVAKVFPPTVAKGDVSRYQNLHAGQFDLAVKLHGPGHPMPKATSVASWSYGTNSRTPELELWLPTNWLRTVYRPGIPVIDGLLVTNARWYTDGVVCEVLYQRRGTFQFHELVTQKIPVADLLGPSKKDVAVTIPWSMR